MSRFQENYSITALTENLERIEQDIEFLVTTMNSREEQIEITRLRTKELELRIQIATLLKPYYNLARS